MQAVIFDMDGTLLDSLTDIAVSNNKVLARNGYSQHSTDAYKNFVGNGIRNLVAMSLPDEIKKNKSILDRLLDEFIDVYENEWIKNTNPYPGISELLDFLEENNIPTAIVTNKRQIIADRMVALKLGQWKFDMVIGEVSGKYKKPDPAGVSAILKKWKLNPTSVCLVGDSIVDMETAKRSGVKPIGVAWGFDLPEKLLKNGAENILKTPNDLIPLLDK